MSFTYWPLEAAAGLAALSPLLHSNTFPFSPSPLLLKWPEFENHLLSGWDVLSVSFQFLVAGTSPSLMRAHPCPESAPHSWEPPRDRACRRQGAVQLCPSKVFRRKISNWVFKGGNVGEALTEQTSSGTVVCPSSRLLVLSHPASSDGCCFRSGLSTRRVFFEVLCKCRF